ncbi:MAG: hypothetical protein SGARI_000080 [Bacillariaceae sp.]
MENQHPDESMEDEPTKDQGQKSNDDSMEVHHHHDSNDDSDDDSHSNGCEEAEFEEAEFDEGCIYDEGDASDDECDDEDYNGNDNDDACNHGSNNARVSRYESAQANKKVRISIEEWIQQGCMIGIANYGRMLGKNLHDGKVGYLWQDEWESIGMVLGTRCAGNPNRCANVYCINDPATKADHVDKEGIPYIPGKDEINHFVRFLGTLSKNGSMAPFRKVLHERSLLEGCKKTILRFGKYLESFRNVLDEAFEDIKVLEKSFKVASPGGPGDNWKATRDDWIDELVGQLGAKEGADPKERRRMRFIFSLVVADVEETAKSPFGSGSDPRLGVGGKRGLICLKEYRGKKSRKQVCQKILDELTSNASDNLLDACGYYRVNEDGFTVLRNKINRNKIELWHMDQWSCKISYVEALRTGSRTIAKGRTSGLTRPYEFPLPEFCRNSYSGVESIHNIATQSLKVLKAFHEKTLPEADDSKFTMAPAHDLFKFMQEDERWPLRLDRKRSDSKRSGSKRNSRRKKRQK